MIVAVWAGLCVITGAATLVLNHSTAPPASQDKPGEPAEDCDKVAAEYARWLIQKETERREATQRGTTLLFRPAGHPEECGDEMFDAYKVVYPDYCKRLADDIAAERKAERNAAREARREAQRNAEREAKATRAPDILRQEVNSYAVPQECADEVRKR